MAGIYVHVPFCHAKCAYCDFYSIADRRRSRDYVEAVGREYDARRHELGNLTPETIYFGGGTPSALSDDELARLSGFFPMASETTMEVNPEDVSPERVRHWVSCGVNRISMGVQSLVDSELKAVGRRHSADDAVAAIYSIRKAGISNISCDLIYGLPGQDNSSWEYSLRRLADCGIDHLSAYALTYEEGTLLTRRRDMGIIEEATEELIDEMYRTLCRVASEYGFEHYEISNFARPGFRSRHNSAYWTGEPYLGLGPGAHSLDSAGIRRYVPHSVKDYISSPETAAVVDEESDDDRINDSIMVGLRTSEGLELGKFSQDIQNLIMTNARQHLFSGNLKKIRSKLVIPESRWLLADSVVRDLFI